MDPFHGVRLVIMYEDESVDVHHGEDYRLHLAPCGSEFILEKPSDPTAHPLQSGEKFRQRTRFAISSYKGLILQALRFRNKYATQPYLPEELFPDSIKERFFSVDLEVEWPSPQASCAELGPNGETRVSSVEGRACLLLAQSGEEFCVEFTCSLSQNQDQKGLSQDLEPRSSLGSESGSSQGDVRTTKPKPAWMSLSSRVVQHHSSFCVPEEWSYPLSLALQHWAPSPETGGQRSMEVPDPSSGERRKSTLPQALPLRCPSPHQHRWKLRNSFGPTERDSEEELPTELLKIVWCEGVVFRIMDGSIPVIEVSPGDGSVIRSHGSLASYFIHHIPEAMFKAEAGAKAEAEERAEAEAGAKAGAEAKAGAKAEAEDEGGIGAVNSKVRQITYHLSSLPPDKPGQKYSVASVVTLASRILNCYNQARHSLKRNAIPSCLHKGTSFPEPVLYKQTGHQPGSDHIHRAESTWGGPSLIAAELEKIKRFNFLLENSNLPLPAQKTSPVRAQSLKDLQVPGGPTLTQTRSSTDRQAPVRLTVSQGSIAEALQRTSRAIQDIDRLLSASSVTH